MFVLAFSSGKSEEDTTGGRSEKKLALNVDRMIDDVYKWFLFRPFVFSSFSQFCAIKNSANDRAPRFAT